MLTDYVGGSTTAGGKLKSTNGWNGKKGNGTDEYGFSALPGGYGNGGSFSFAGNYGFWWSATEDDAENAWSRGMSYNNESVVRGSYYSYVERSLFSVRCVAD